MKSIAIAAVVCASAILCAAPGAAARQPPFVTAADLASLDTYPQSTALGWTGATDLEIYRPAGTPEFAQFSIFVPTGFDLGLSRTIGTNVGTLIAWEVAGTGHKGSITVDDPAKHTADPCAPGAHLAVWLLSPAGMSPLPAYIDKTAGAETSMGGYKIVICVPSSATSGLTLHQFDFAPTITNPATSAFYMWRVLVVPYSGGKSNPSGAYELRSREPLPISLTLRSRYLKGRAVLTGKLASPAASTAGIYINLFKLVSGRSAFVNYTFTRAGGSFKFSRRIRKATTFYVEVGSMRGCQDVSVAPGGCIGETMVAVSSRSVKVRLPRRR